MSPLVLGMKKGRDSSKQIGLLVLMLILLLGHGIKFSSSSQSVFGTSKIENNFFILIKGEIENPGVYAFSKKPSLKQIIGKAGGFTAKLKGATWDNNPPNIKRNISLKIGLEDGYICASTKSIQPEYKITLQIPISINTATMEELESIPYIGPFLAKKILHYRSFHGPFKSIEEIMKLDGIGRIRFLKLKSFIEI